MGILSKLFGGNSTAAAPKATPNATPNATRNILLMLPWLPVSGVEVLYSGRFKDLPPGCKITVVTTREPLPNMGDRTAAMEAIGCEVIHLPKLGNTDDERIAQFWKIFESGSFHNLLICGSRLGYELLPEIKRCNPKIQVVDELWDEGKQMSSNDEFNEYIDATIVPNEPLAETMRLRAQSRQKPLHPKIALIRCGLNIPTAAERKQYETQGRAMLPAEAKGKFVVGFFARFSPEKNGLMFVEIVKRLRNEQDIFFMMVGDGPQKDEIEARINQLQLQDRIFRPGFQQQIDPLVAVSDVIVVPSSNDGQPLILLHAGSHSKPVIASRVGIIPLVIRHNENGFLLDPQSLDSFCEHIKKLYEDRQLAKSLGKRGFEIACSEFDEHVINRSFTALLEEAAVD